jgi:diaminopimelate decarboxylase
VTLLPTHAAIDEFDVIDNELAIGGAKLSGIVRAHGPSPMFVYDSAVIRRQVSKLR